MFTNRQVATFYFQQVLYAQDEPVAGYFRCRCSRVHQQAPRTGYSNLVSHVRSQHPDFEEVMGSAVPAETGTLVPWIRRRSLNLFGWLRWTVMCNLPLHFCENPETRRYSNLDPIGEEQLLEGIACVVQHVKTIMRSELPDHFGLKLDGWSHNSEYYLAVFVCYELGGQPRCQLLAMAPLVQAPSQDLSAQGHVDFLRDMLSHDYATRWSSTFCTVNRYVKLLEFIQDDDDLAEYLPSPAANHTLRKLLKDLKKIESVSKELQSKSVSIADVRSYFDALIELWPEFATYLGPRGAIVHNTHFEAGCVKVQRGELAKLTRSEKAALSRFAVLEAVEQPLATDHETTGSFVEQVKKKRKTSTPTATYMLLKSGFFSVAKATLGLQRQRLQPATLEMILFLRMNDALWDVNVVNECC
ncbi:Ribonuclease H-like domain [Phytophthora cactorum]|nr:Ribonuclease H-like domain [Phytophthora cactorum]